MGALLLVGGEGRTDSGIEITHAPRKIASGMVHMRFVVGCGELKHVIASSKTGDEDPQKATCLSERSLRRWDDTAFLRAVLRGAFNPGVTPGSPGETSAEVQRETRFPLVLISARTDYFQGLVVYAPP